MREYIEEAIRLDLAKASRVGAWLAALCATAFFSLLVGAILLFLSGCVTTGQAVDAVTDQAVKLQKGYCRLSDEGKAVAAKQYRSRLPEGYSLQVGCPES